MKKLFLILFSVLAFTSQVRADVEWTIWEGEQSFDTESGGVTDIGSYCRSIQKGDILTFTVDLGTYGYHQKTLDVKSATGGWATTYLANYVNFTDAEISACAYTQEVTAKMYEEIVTNNGMFEVGGKGYTLKKVTVTRSLNSCIKTTLANLTANGSFDGHKLLNYAVAGDYIYVDATVATGKAYGQYKLEGNSVSTPIYNVYDKLLLTLTGEQIAAWTTEGIWPWSTLENLSKANIYLIHPVNSFKIGSIGMATFSANQEVKVPNGLTAYKATVSGNNVTLTQFTNNVIPAGKGAIIKGNEVSAVEFVASSTGSEEESALLPVTTATNVSTLAEEGFELYVLSACEKEDDLALSTLLGGFGGWNAKITWDSETYTATYTEQTPNSEGGRVGADWSAYDKLKLNFKSNTLDADATFYVAYNGHDDATTEATLTKGSTSSVEIKLNSDYKNAIGNFSMWSNATEGSLTFESAALIDNNGGTVAEFRKTEKGTIAANKAYLKIASGLSKLNIVFAEDENKQEEEQQGETNSIRNIANTNVNNNVVYNMNGQRVGSDYKGIVIVNGKKIIKK